ncbi:MAG: phage major capsid protein [Azoarcus sp.]|nr:MAG: phage major capsid protein [Azoarcus sp.]
MTFANYGTDAEKQDRHLARLASQINILDVLRYQAGISRESLDIGPAAEYSQEIARRSGRPANGFYFPHEALATRGLTAGTATAGGNTVATNMLANSFIDMLRPRAKVLQAGASVLSGLTGNVAIPRQTAAAAAYWVSEGNDVTESQPAFDQVQMTPKTVGAYTEVSRKLLLQSSVSIADFVGRDLTSVIGLAMDAATINGIGGAQPTGILNTSGVLTQTIAGAAPTWAEIVGFETRVAAESADEPSCAYLTTPAVRGVLRQAMPTAYAEDPIWMPAGGTGADGTVNGYRAFISSNVPANLGVGTDKHAVLFGNWSDVIVGLWGAVDVLLDPYSLSKSGGMRVTAFQDLDVCVRHPESFCVGQFALA